jgi:hypothetical protein
MAAVQLECGNPARWRLALPTPGCPETSTSRGGESMEVYILEVEVLEAKIAPGRGISLGGQ